MGWLVVILAPLLFALFAVYAVLKFAVVLVRICFAPVVWLSRQPRQQRVELYPLLASLTLPGQSQ
jgi:hypothetical protein